MAEGQEQNRSEEPTPFKLRRAREKGQVARGMDLGFVAGLVALAGFAIVAGDRMVADLAQLMRQALAAIGGAADPREAAAVAAALYWPAMRPLVLLGGTIVLIVLLLEIVQLRGLVFSSHPLKPDFSRLNPAKGLKRIFSMRMLKEALKNVVKLAAYVTVSALLIWSLVSTPGRSQDGADGLATAMSSGGMRLLLLFILVAFFFAAIDQIIVRREFHKQMRMSRREVTRETKDREGEPRIKQKRKQLHAEFAKQGKSLGSLPGSDLLVVNPQHFAVALAYDPSRMSAPTVTAKARN
ncbi:MAG TPA: EscU/YscU/HrcU family type III secretion system export apparatus switch protein, partial [Allosphingosinicella sp.]|nr:EscU/YscU/HrcU family type III secretion system export apparatus switch protein [Allosphingosinicella sp.]